MEELGFAPVAPTHPIEGGKGAGGKGASAASSSTDGEDLYLKLKRAQRQLEMVDIQVSYGSHVSPVTLS